MPPKITDSRPNPDAAVHTVEEQTASGARRIVATYAEDLVDGVTLMCMLGIEPQGLVYKQFAEDYEAEIAAAEEEESSAKKSTKKTTKKASKKMSKKSTKKTAKKAAKKTTKKATKKSTKKTTKKAAKKTTGDEG
ncbi:histone [Corynebacterium sp. P3-F1]|uniref:histone n=1 Tax=Corynebacterium sp. P3-F1 TaxID=3059080 RepID=UPI00265D478D|nr:histone [Corynebacterium sp. P3-F1]WKK62122.1 histone [Corynebacterium sp. P3-F1]